MLKNVLIVDDSRSFHGAYMLFMKPYKCSFIHAMNGQEALEILSAQEDVDLILLDINMPVMNGIQFLERASATGIPQRIPVIIASSEKQDIISSGLKLGARGHLNKPFQEQDMLQLIDRIFEPGYCH